MCLCGGTCNMSAGILRGPKRALCPLELVCRQLWADQTGYWELNNLGLKKYRLSLLPFAVSGGWRWTPIVEETRLLDYLSFIYSEDLSSCSLAPIVSESAVKAGECLRVCWGREQLTVLPGCSTYEPQQWLAWWDIWKDQKVALACVW